MEYVSTDTRVSTKFKYLGTSTVASVLEKSTAVLHHFWGLIDASCNWLHSKLKNRGQNIFSRKLRAKIQFPRLLFSSLRNISSYNPHTVLKNAHRGRVKNIYLF